MDRILAIADISAWQRNEWKAFKEQWDQKMATCHGADWARIFSEIMMQVCQDLIDGKPHALSEFMHNETKRVLSVVQVLPLPAPDQKMLGEH